MKKFLLIGCILAATTCVSAQSTEADYAEYKPNVTVDTNGYYVRLDKIEKPTGRYYMEDRKLYPVYINPKGKMYIKRMKPNTTKVYRYYLKPTKTL